MRHHFRLLPGTRKLICFHIELQVLTKDQASCSRWVPNRNNRRLLLTSPTWNSPHLDRWCRIHPVLSHVCDHTTRCELLGVRISSVHLLHHWHRCHFLSHKHLYHYVPTAQATRSSWRTNQQFVATWYRILPWIWRFDCTGD